MTDLADPATDLVPEATPRPNGVRREPTAKTVELARAIELALVGATYQQIADNIYDPDARAERRDPRRASKAEADAVRHLLTSPDGQRALRYAVNEQQEHTERFLVSAHLQALRTLVTEMGEATKSGDRIRAATAIVSLATKKVEISGKDGGSIDVTAVVIDALDERIKLMNERSKGIIEAYAVPVTAEVEAETSPSEAPEAPAAPGPSAVADRIAEILASVPVPAPVEEAVPAVPAVPAPPRRRMPAPIIRPRPGR